MHQHRIKQHDFNINVVPHPSLYLLINIRIMIVFDPKSSCAALTLLLLLTGLGNIINYFKQALEGSLISISVLFLHRVMNKLEVDFGKGVQSYLVQTGIAA